MSSKREFNEIDEPKLKEAAGGMKNFYPIFSCPKCGATKKVRNDPEFGLKVPYCIKCSVMMYRIQ